MIRHKVVNYIRKKSTINITVLLSSMLLLALSCSKNETILLSDNITLNIIGYGNSYEGENVILDKTSEIYTSIKKDIENAYHYKKYFATTIAKGILIDSGQNHIQLLDNTLFILKDRQWLYTDEFPTEDYKRILSYFKKEEI